MTDIAAALCRVGDAHVCVYVGLCLCVCGSCVCVECVWGVRVVCVVCVWCVWGVCPAQCMYRMCSL
jgi:hypothetical protein